MVDETLRFGPFQGQGVILIDPLTGAPSGAAGAAGSAVTLTDASGVPIDFSGITSRYRLLSALATTNAASIKASSGYVYWVRGRNNKAASIFIKLYNKASAPTVGTDVPVDTIDVPASSTFVYDFPAGAYHAAGIAVAITALAPDADTTALVAGDVTCLSVGYA